MAEYIDTEAETAETPTQAMVPLGPGGALTGAERLADPAAMRQQLASYSEARGIFLDWVLDALVAGTDYMTIHRKTGRGANRQDCPNADDKKSPRCERCGAKATLCKPGSEKICGLLRLRPRFSRDLDTWEMLGSEAGMLALRCELLDAHGAVVAEGRACRKADLDYGDVNKTIKMVQKSAQTDAVLRHAGLSEVFTLDLEDQPTGDTERPTFGAVPRRAAAPAPTPPPASPPPPADPSWPSDEEAPPYETPPSRPATSQRGASAQRPKAMPEAPPPPDDAISTGKVRRLYALIHEAVGDDRAEFERVKTALKDALRQATGREHLEHCPWKGDTYEQLAGPWLDAAVAGQPIMAGRSHARLVRPRGR